MYRIAIAGCLTVCLGAAIAAEPPKKASAAAKAAPKAVRTPSMEQLTCRTGPNDEQVRLTVVVIKGRPMEFAYYSRHGNKVCSIHGRRGDAYTKWEDKPDKAHVTLLEGGADLEYRPGYVKLKFFDVGRMPYCGMLGELNGEVEVVSKRTECGFLGVFDCEDCPKS